LAQNVTKQTLSHVNQYASLSPTAEPLYQEVNRAQSGWDGWGTLNHDPLGDNETAFADLSKKPQAVQDPKKSNDDWEDW
jgi:hypothetical protein